MPQKILIIALLFILFPVLLKISFYLFLFFLFIILILTIPFFVCHYRFMKILNKVINRNENFNEYNTIIIDIENNSQETIKQKNSQYKENGNSKKYEIIDVESRNK
ncbi:MAG: hypothetical protein K5657_00405 [Desulfovibrio sp.]|nr:hypothetical protein [Desulfovibrio sp.]